MAPKRSEFDQIVRKYSTVIAAAIRRVCLQRYESLLPDVTQEVHVALWKAIKEKKQIDNPAAYIYRVALTTGLKIVEREKRQAVASSSSENSEAMVDPRSEILERAKLLEQLLDKLKPDEAKALRAYLAGYSHTEIAQLFGWSPSVARHNVYRSIDKLKRQCARELSQTDWILNHG